MARDRVYRVMITDPVKRVILSAELDASVQIHQDPIPEICSC